MKIKKISNEEVIVFLNTSDLELFDLSPESFEPRSAELHRFLFMLMETVREETGFDPYEGQVVVEAATSENGVHLSISKINHASRKISKENFNKATSVKIKGSSQIGRRERKSASGHDADMAADRLYRSLFNEQPHGRMPRKGSDRKREGCFIFFFSTYIDMESALCTLKNSYISKGELYRNNKRYAMILPLLSLDGCYHLLEFSESCSKSRIAADDIREGWKKVAEGGELLRLAEAVKEMH